MSFTVTSEQINSSIGFIPSTYSVNSLSQLKALTFRPPAVIMNGYYTAGDGGGGTFEWIPNSSETANDGIIIQCTSGPVGRYKRIYDGNINAKWFGVKGDGVTDDTTSLQNCINYAQTLKAWIYLPSVQTGYLVTGLTIGTDTNDYTCHFTSGNFDTSAASYAGNPSQYVGMGLIKLKDNSNTHLFTIKRGAPSPIFYNMTLMGNGAAQSGTSWVIYCEDAPTDTDHYNWSVRLDHCHILSGRSGGVYLGTFRGGFLAEKTWFQYCGTTTSDAAIYCSGYDLQMDMCGIGSNTGYGLRLFGGIQIQLSNNVFWMNNTHLRIDPGVSDVNCIGDQFDAGIDHGVIVYGSTESYSHGVRNFVGCKWRRNSNGTTNTKSDIVIDSDDRITLTSPDFQGDGGTGKKVKYNIETVSTYRAPIVKVVSPSFTDNSGTFAYATAFCNNLSQISLESPGLPVQWFGARGDGITNDTAAIQEAINLASTARQNVLLATRHAVGSQINIPANTTIIGAGSKTIINALSGTYNMFSLNGDDITIQNLMIDDSSKTAGWDFIIDCGATSVNRTLLQNIVTTSSYGFLTDTGSGGGIHITTRLNFIQCKQHRGPGIQVERAFAFLYWKEVAIDFGGSFNPNFTGFSISGTGIFGGGLVLEDCSVSGTSGTTSAANQIGFSITDFSDVWFNRTLADTCDGKGYNLFLVNKVYFTAASAGHCNDTGFNLSGVGGAIGDIQIYGRKNLSSPAANIDGLRFSSCTDISLGGVLVRECTGHGINKNGIQSGPIRISGLISQENVGYGISSSGDSAFLVVGAQLNANTSGDYDMDGIYDYLQVSQLTNGSVVSVGPGPISG